MGVIAQVAVAIVEVEGRRVAEEMRQEVAAAESKQAVGAAESSQVAAVVIALVVVEKRKLKVVRLS